MDKASDMLKRSCKCQTRVIKCDKGTILLLCEVHYHCKKFYSIGHSLALRLISNCIHLKSKNATIFKGMFINNINPDPGQVAVLRNFLRQ